MVRITLYVIMGMAFLLNGIAYAGSDTFANSMEISSKQSDGKGIAAMPDVCLSPPSPPAGPVPVPYPNTQSASDTQKGSKKVKMNGKQIMLKGEKFKKSTGDEAGTTDNISSQNTKAKRYRKVYRHKGPKRVLEKVERP